MDKKEFEEEYIKGSKLTAQEYREDFVTLPCECDYENCKGWAAIHNSQRMIDLHNDLHKPTV